MLMPWGVHKDKNIHDIPSWYLKWVAENWDETTLFKKKIVEECDKEWQWREKHNKHIGD